MNCMYICVCMVCMLGMYIVCMYEFSMYVSKHVYMYGIDSMYV